MRSPTTTLDAPPPPLARVTGVPACPSPAADWIASYRGDRLGRLSTQNHEEDVKQRGGCPSSSSSRASSSPQRVFACTYHHGTMMVARRSSQPPLQGETAADARHSTRARRRCKRLGGGPTVCRCRRRPRQRLHLPPRSVTRVRGARPVGRGPPAGDHCMGRRPPRGGRAYTARCDHGLGRPAPVPAAPLGAGPPRNN